MKLRVVNTTGNPIDTRITTEDGQDIEGVKQVDISIDRDSIEVRLKFVQLEVDVLAEDGGE